MEDVGKKRRFLWGAEGGYADSSDPDQEYNKRWSERMLEKKLR